MASVGFAEVSLLTTWMPATRGAHHGHLTLISKTTPGRSLPSPATLPFTVAGRGANGPTPLLYLPPTLWAPSEAGQEPPHPLLRHPPALQSPRLKQAPLSSGAGKIYDAALLNDPNMPLTSYWYTGLHDHSPGGVVKPYLWMGSGKGQHMILFYVTFSITGYKLFCAICFVQIPCLIPLAHAVLF